MGFCRSELAREKSIAAALIQNARVIVDVFREQARSYSIGAGPVAMEALSGSWVEPAIDSGLLLSSTAAI
ncbi:hypothetical protein TU82_09520 [Pseudomonas orientalis]|nr:hypothetical protein TU82_09520 [Pseudomonas orientalis]